MLAHHRNIVKKGWVYKRGSSCVSRWRLRWAVLTSEPFVGLAIHESRDSPEPKYIIKPDNIQIVLLENMPKAFLESSRDHGFVVIAKTRKFYFAAQSAKERDEWIQCLHSYANPAVTGHLQQPSVAMTPAPRAATGMTNSHHAGGEQRPESAFNDAASVYSAYTYRSGVSRSSSRAESAYSRRASAANVAASIEERAASLQALQTTYGDLRPLTLDNRVVLSVDDMVDLLADRPRHRKSVLLNPMEEWSEKYARFLRARDHHMDATRAMGEDIDRAVLIGAFQELAKYFGRKIIDKLHTSASAEQGPETFVYGDILFHFAAEYAMAEDMPDLVQSQEKKATHEIKSINAINQTALGLCTALMCVLDYKGFRMVAYASMPLDEQRTLVLDLAAESPRIEPHALDFLKPVGAALNLKEHEVTLGGGQSVQTSIASNIEIHNIPHTGTFYALNVSDLFPVDKHPKRDVVYENKLRPEFVRTYHTALSSDALVEGQDQRLDDTAAMEASEYLRGKIIPEFVFKLDTLTVLPIDSRGLTTEMHLHGINMRYLSTVYRLTQLPYVRDLCAIEMLARVSKRIVAEKLRRAIYHFRDVEANNIEEEIKSYAVRLMNQILGAPEQQRKFWNEHLRAGIQLKFDIALDETVLINVHKPALFHALQHHCGVEFSGTLDYDFFEASPVHMDHFKRFIVKTKHVNIPTRNEDTMSAVGDEEKHMFALGKHLAVQGPSSRCTKSTVTSMRLAALSKFYLESGALTTAGLLSKLATRTVPPNHASFATAQLAMLEAEFMLARAQGLEKIDFALALYQRVMATMEFHWGTDHPVLMSAYDKMAHVLSKADRPERGYEFIEKSLQLAKRTLGPVHPVTAGYMAKSGYLLLSLHRTAEALELFTESMHIFERTQPGSEAVAENHYCIAESLMDKGDLDGAIHHSTQAKQIREQLYGSMHSKTVDSYQQLGKLLAANYSDYDGVVTPQIRKDLMSAITCYERVFKFMKVHKEYTMKMKSGFKRKESILLTLTRTLIGLKLRLVPSEQRELLRSLRESPMTFPEETVKETILRLVHLTPSIYLEEIFQRLGDHDRDAIDELGTVLQIAEAPSLSFA